MKEEESINDLARSRQENTELSEEARVKAVSAVVDAMGDALLLHSLDGKILFVNPAYEKMTGYDRSELVGKDVAEVGVNSKEGRKTPCAFTVSFMKDAKDKPTTAVVVLKDIIEFESAGPEWVNVAFTDTGIGILEENLKRVFEPLFTSKAKGIGLGLAVTRTLVEGHGGSIEVQSEPGKGTTFSVRRPTGNREGE